MSNLNAAVAKIADLTAANTVSGTISALPDFSNVTTDNKAAIEAARAAYNALTADQKALVSADTLKKLTDAEDKLVIIQVMSEVSAKTGSGMTYTGSPIQLVNTPTTALPEGYTMKYAVTTENVAPTDDNLYTTSIPAKTDAGTYYVWYKVVGDGNHKDTEPKPVTVTIAAKATATATVTFKVANGEWNAGGNQEVPVTLTGEDGGKPVLKPADFPAVGNAPAEGFKEGSWNPAKPTADTVLKDGETLTYTYTYAPKGTVRATVTFKVRNGSWDDGTAADKSITLTGKEGDELRLAEKDIPAVGGKPDAGYKAGSWDVMPSTDTAIAKDTTYTYTYVAKGDPKPTPTPSPVPTPAPVPGPVQVPTYAGGFYTYGTSSGSSSSSSSSSSEPAVERAGMHRMFNPATGEHFYTASDAERDDLVGKGWSYEGIAFWVPKKSNTPVWRLFNPATGEHYYTN